MVNPDRDVLINGRRVGAGHPIYCIAEVGSNHNGDWSEAEYLTRACAEAGADAIKFQAYTREELFNPALPSPVTEQDAHNLDLLEKRWNILPKYTVDARWWPKLADLCQELGVDFLCTPFSLESLELLAPLMPAIKIASGDVTWLELLRASGTYGKPVIFSTGASTMEEAVNAAEAVRNGGCEDIVALHCVSSYPPRWEQANLRSMPALGEALDVAYGLSDHSPGSTLPLGARTLGACVLEKHVTRDRSQEGLDHHFAMTPAEFGEMVNALRNLEQALGSTEKCWTDDEEIERFWVRRGLWVKRDLMEGECLRRQDLSVLRPCLGIEANKLSSILGKKIGRALYSNQPLHENDLT